MKLLFLVLGLIALVSADPLFRTKQRRDVENPVDASAVEEASPEGKGIISVIQSTADKLGLGSFLGNKKKKPADGIATTPKPYKVDLDANPAVKSQDESNQQVLTGVSSEGIDNSSPISESSDEGKSGVAGYLGGSLATALQTGGILSQTAGSVIDNKVSGVLGYFGSGSAAQQGSAVASATPNQAAPAAVSAAQQGPAVASATPNQAAPAAVSAAARSLDVKDTGFGGLLGGSLATALQAGAVVTQTAGSVVDNKIASLGGLLGSSPTPLQQPAAAVISRAERSLGDGKTGVAGLLGSGIATAFNAGAQVAGTAGAFVDNKVSGLGGLLGSAAPANQPSPIAASTVARSSDVKDIGFGGFLGGGLATALQAGATVSETAGTFVDNKIAGLGGLLGSTPVQQPTAAVAAGSSV